MIINLETAFSAVKVKLQTSYADSNKYREFYFFIFYAYRTELFNLRQVLCSEIRAAISGQTNHGYLLPLARIRQVNHGLTRTGFF